MSINIGNNTVKKIYKGDRLILSTILNPVGNFAAIMEGMGFDASGISGMYNGLDPIIKEKAIKVLLPVGGSPGVLYGIDNKTGEIVPFAFERSSVATLFDNTDNLVQVGNDIPRVDFLNYTDRAKILIEKDATNLATGTDLSNHESINQWTAYGTPVISQQLNKYFEFKYGGSGNFVAARTGNIIELIQNVPYQLSAQIQNIANSNVIDYVYMIRSGNTNIRLPYGPGVSANEHFNNWQVAYTDPDGFINASLLFGKTWGNNGDTCFRFRYMQFEQGAEKTSFIPTVDIPVTRSADLLSVVLDNSCSVYLETTKQKIVLDKPSGIWSIHNDLDNEGIYALAIFGNVLTAEDKQQLLNL